MMSTLPPVPVSASIWQDLPPAQQDALVRLLAQLAVKYLVQPTTPEEVAHVPCQPAF